MSSRFAPPRWLMAVLMGCLCAVLVFFLSRPDLSGPSAEAAAPTPSLQPLSPSSPVPLSTPTPEPTPPPQPHWSLPLPEGEAADTEVWFFVGGFLGDSRTDGLKLFSGIPSGAVFLDYTGLTVYDVVKEKKVIRSGGEKLSILDALAADTYGKIYISLGVNELGYYDPEGFSETYAQVIDAIQACQPEARLYIQSILPVNSDKCKANEIPYYVTNEGVSNYNEVLPALCQKKKVRLLDIPDGLQTEEGETPADLSADGVHFKKEGYRLWLDYLITHTGQ